MKMKISTLSKRIHEIFLIDWIHTLRFNFKYFDFRTARILPVLLYKSKIVSMLGKVEIIGKPRTGMIKFGKVMVPTNQCHVGFVYENNGGLLRIGQTEIGCGGAISIQKDAVIVLGNHFHSTSGCKIICAKKIQTGINTRIGWDVLIMDTDWHSVYNIETKRISSKTKEIVIGDYVWIANGVSVMKGSRIPNFSIIAGKSLVNRVLERENSLYAGSPAKLIKTSVVRDEFIEICEACKSK